MKHRWVILMLLGGSLLRVVAEAPAASHWAFQPIRDPALPTVTHTNWLRTSIDRFILARLEAVGVQPSPTTGRHTLLRRVTYDLTGLPPSADDIDRFIADPAPDALSRVIDGLLESPHYGEHWGRHWLDVVRYADTAGETADYPVPVAWRYRNYVIDAFNQDKPYDQFLREQIAGDILARTGPRDRYAEQVVATGYLAVSRRFGFDSENYHHLTLQDTIDTVGQSVLGLTLGCARCHNHKFDPVSIADYYALYGIFESTRYAFPGSEQKQRHRALVPLLPPEESAVRWQQFESRIANLTARVERARLSFPNAILRSLDDLDGDFEMQAPAAGGSKGVLVPPWIPEGPVAITTDAQSPFRNLHPGGRVGVSIPAGTNIHAVGQALHPLRYRGQSGTLHINLDFRVATNEPTARGPHRFWLGSTPANPAFEVLLSAESLQLKADEDIETIPLPHPGQWHSLQLALDLREGTWGGSIGLSGHSIPLALRPLSTTWNGELTHLGFDSGNLPGSFLPAVAFDNLAVRDTPIPPVPMSPPAATANTDETQLERDALTADAEKARRELESLLADGPFDLAYAVSEGTPRDARIHLRGEPDRPGDPVPRGFLPVLGGRPLPRSSRGSGRLELADWLVHPSHPLTARVMVNRIWQFHFGQGLVRTPNDFGTRGQPPSDPDLLDHLATRFIQSGWSVKAMHRLILNSATYRMRSEASQTTPPDPTPAPADDCPVFPTTGNLPRRNDPGLASLAARAPTHLRRRLSAEETRDSLLKVSGELDPSAGQGHPFPSPTGWGYTQHGPFNAVYDHTRRSVYLMNQRIRRHPFLALFDGPDPNASTAERPTTTVPTQALYFLNDPFVHTCAHRFAARVEAAAPDEAGRIQSAWRMALGRLPTAEESVESAQFLAAAREELVAGGVKDPTQAALASFARVLFGSNEFLTID